MPYDPEPDIFHELTKRADLGVNLWSSLLLAAERGDTAAVNYHCRQIRILTRSTFALVKTLGAADGETVNG